MARHIKEDSLIISLVMLDTYPNQILSLLVAKLFNLKHIVKSSKNSVFPSWSASPVSIFIVTIAT